MGDSFCSMFWPGIKSWKPPVLHSLMSGAWFSELILDCSSSRIASKGHVFCVIWYSKLNSCSTSCSLKLDMPFIPYAQKTEEESSHIKEFEMNHVFHIITLLIWIIISRILFWILKDLPVCSYSIKACCIFPFFT